MQTLICVLAARLRRCPVLSNPLKKLNGGLSRLHSADEDAVSWLTMVHDMHTKRRRRLATCRHRIEFKTATLQCFKAVKLGTPCLNNALKPYAPLRALGSSNINLLTVPRAATSLGLRRFSNLI